ncbi:MAG: oxygen-independent coproporphyrinogen III oxidase [Cytophagales bacterium]|nr:oxygen-independent coproporphyrinogen III oxidase [Cytophagales bacterium]
MQTITPTLIQTFDIAGPRYTSYPTADRFVEAFGMEDFVLALQQRKAGIGRTAAPLSLYVHIPFCDSLCYYCACNKIVTKHHERAAQYLQYLEREIDITIDYLGAGKTVSQLHLGGGTPTFLSDDELERLMRMIRQNFQLSAQGEYAIEIDPRTIDEARLQTLANLGFNRLSFGVQDFNPQVQKAVHRMQPFEQVKALMLKAGQIGFQSQNVDLIYGLPMQSSASFARTLEQVIELRPDRIALYAYAHLPERFKAQRRINANLLPDAATKIAMHSQSIARLMEAGYDYIGMDHFALQSDSLAIAKRQGLLQRNFQGYSTQSDCDMLSFGVSAIGKIGSTYSQNAKTLDEYYDALDHGHLPIARGLSLTHDDVVRRAVIMAIMCQGRVDYESIELAYLIQFNSYFAKEVAQLKALETSGMIELTHASMQVTELGWFFVRGIAMVFDKYLQADRARAQFSKII